MKWKIQDNFSLTFDFMCKCFNHDVKKFIFSKKENRLEMLCTICERKYTVDFGIQEKK